jgi:hypothetical protein
MSRIKRSIVAGIVAGIALTLTLEATAATARPLRRAALRTPAPTGFAERIWSWWSDLAARATPLGGRRLSPLSARAGSQMDPNGDVASVTLPRNPPLANSPNF